MAISKWLCTKSAKNMFVKIVHPGGRKELHDRPILASEIMLRNPKCVVACPHIFQEPWAIVPQDTILMLGQKFYVVPMSTVRKLQRYPLKFRCNSPVPDVHSSEADNKEEEDNCKVLFSACGICLNKNTKAKDSRRGSCLSNGRCLVCMFNGFKKKVNGEVSSSSSRFCSSFYGTRKRNKDLTTGSPIRSFTAYDHWQPALESICEE